MPLDIDKVAAVAQEALDMGMSPYKAICEVFDVSYYRANYYIHRCRETGRLSRSMRPQHSPTPAVIYRGTHRERVWEVCQACLVPWPCEAGQDAPRVL